MSMIAIVADSHDNIPNIEEFFKFCRNNKVDFVIHCGDVTEKETEALFKKEFKDKIVFVPGNADIENQTGKTNRFQKIKRAPVPFLDLVIDNIPIGACHKKDKAVRLAETEKYHYVFYGHTHKPWEDNLNGTRVVNPGNLAGMFYPASFALLDTTTNNVYLKILYKNC
jgi:putative phosphoesterase